MDFNGRVAFGFDEWVTGKALVLDEIINYVQSLQNQVEVITQVLVKISSNLNSNGVLLLTHEQFLSMKLASLDPILYDIVEDYDDRMIQRQV